MDKITFMIVNRGENVMKGSTESPFSFSCSPFSLLPLHNFSLLVKVKCVNVGINTTEGCATKVLSMLLLLFLLCQQETIPRMKPGRNIVAKMVAITGNFCSSGTGFSSSGPRGTPGRPEKGEASAIPFPTREKRHAPNINRNLNIYK